MSYGEIRIIGGMWRGRKLKVPQLPGLRPTTDRIRETVFNWLQMALPGATCLDIFTGSGALGIEALSRGAKHVVMVDKSPTVVASIRKHLSALKADNGEVYEARVPQQLKKPAKGFDIIFMDPPFDSDVLVPTCRHLEEQGFLANNALIYLESSRLLTQDDLPANWLLVKSKKTGQVAYHLAERHEEVKTS